MEEGDGTTTIENGARPGASASHAEQKDLCDVCEEAFRGLFAVLEDDDTPHIDFADPGTILSRDHQVVSVYGRPGEPDIGLGFRHQKSWLALFDASNRGCKVCKMLYHAERIAIAGANSMAYDAESELVFWCTQSDPLIGPAQRCCVSFLLRYVERKNVSIGPFELSTPSSSLSRLPSCPAHSLPPIEYIRGWIEICKRYHPDCWSSPGLDLPTRLLEIEKGNDTTVVRLIETTEHMAGFIQFVALSYCWGDVIPASTLTTSNIENHKSGLSIGNLPATFRDAVLVCESLGYKYLWIDSLCIVQDDVGDWQEESVRMADVYSSAVFTIAASDAANPDSGLLIGRSAPGVTSHFAFRHKSGSMLPLIATQLGPNDPGPLESNRYVPTSSLLKRAWALQEELLSPRYVSFTDHKLSMQCRHAFFSEHSSVSTMRPEIYRTLYAPKSALGTRHRPSTATNQENFYSLILDYTKRRIRYADDRLPAFSALAKMYKQHEDDNYCAGLWQSTLIDDLLWSADTDEHAEINYCVPAKLKTPSWSWVSCETRVYYTYLIWQRAMKAEAEVLAAKVSLIGGDPYGQVNGGRITIEGRTFACSTHATQRRCMRSRERIACLQDEPNHFFAVANMDSLSENGFVDGILYVGLMLQVQPATDKRKQQWLGLLLKRVNDGRSDEVYQRVGMLTDQFIDRTDWVSAEQRQPKSEIARLLAFEKRSVTII